jgi:hypothetical protein
MIISTNLPNDDERSAALAVVPWRESVRRLSTEMEAAYVNGALDLIDASIGPANHCRAALVSLFDGATMLVQATTDLAESVVRQKVFARTPPLHPYTFGDELEPNVQAKLTLRYAAYSIEDAAVRVASAGDHLANAHIRLAWEANVATLTEVIGCGFDPAEAEPERWITVAKLREGLKKAEGARSGTLRKGILADFAPNEAFLACADSAAVESVRSLRDHVVHRERPRYRELPGFGRTSLWTQGNFSIVLPPQEAPDQAKPTLDDRRREVGRGLVETLRYAQALWAHTKRWLPTIGVLIIPVPGAVEVTTKHQIGWQSQRFPRENRDPGPFLRRR